MNGREIGIFYVGDEFFALFNRCPHQGAPLVPGRHLRPAGIRPARRLTAWSRKGEMLRCPWHGWESDIRTGQSWCDPDSVLARTFHVSVEPGEALAKGPFMAETVPVRVEQNYVVVEV